MRDHDHAPDGIENQKEIELCKLGQKSLSLFFAFSFLLVSVSVYGQAGKSPLPSEQPAASYSVKPSPAGMTDAEIVAELMANLEKREAILKQDREALTRDQESLETEKKILATDKNLMEQRKQLLTETESYWKNYKSDTLKDKIAAGLIGFALGFAGGNYTGFRLGITVPLR